MALVDFATSARTLVSSTTDATTFTNAVNGINPPGGNAGGTNWEMALRQADTINFGDSDPTYVIFFSDGAPTFYGTGPSGTGGKQEPNMSNSYNASTDEAAALASKVGKDRFYTIFAYGSDAGRTYMTNLTAAAGAPAATFENSEAKWDLKSEGVLEDGVTYTVTFDCWPSQTTLDIVADIKNDPSSYDSLDPEIKKYIDRDGNLKTNTSATLSYDDTRTPDEEEPVDYTNPDPVQTAAVEQLAISKEWENELDSQTADAITLTVTRDGSDHHTMVLSEDNE